MKLKIGNEFVEQITLSFDNNMRQFDEMVDVVVMKRRMIMTSDKNESNNSAMINEYHNKDISNPNFQIKVN